MSRVTSPKKGGKSALKTNETVEQEIKFHFSEDLANELNCIEDEAKIEADRKRQAELTRLRELARFD